MSHSHQNPAKQTEMSLAQLESGLRSEDPSNRVSAMSDLQQLGGPDATRVLAAHVHDRVSEYLDSVHKQEGGDGYMLTMRAIERWLLIACFAMLPAIIIWSIRLGGEFFVGFEILVILVVMYLLAFFIRHSTKSDAQKAMSYGCTVFEEIESAGAVIALGPACPFMAHEDPNIRMKSTRAVLNLIPKADENALKLLRGDAAHALRSEMLKDKCSPEMRDAAFMVLAQAGDEVDFTNVEIWFRYQKPSDSDLRLMRTFRERIEQEKLSNTLLRPSKVGDAELLLRPTSLGTADSHLLLRPLRDTDNQDHL